MGNLKFKTKKSNNADVERIAKVIKAVNDFVALSILAFADDGSANVYVYPQVFIGKDEAYHLNFCKNLLIYYKLHSGKTPEETRNTVLNVFSKEELVSDQPLFTFSDKKGFESFYDG